MAFLRGLLALPLIVAIVLFAISHTEKVSITLNPFSSAIELPLFIVTLAFLIMGFIIGAVISWFSMHSVRKTNRQQKKTIKNLEKELEKSKEQLDEKLIKPSVTDLTPIEPSKVS